MKRALPWMLLVPLSAAAEAPVPKTVQEANAALAATSEAQQAAALKALTTACRGALRLTARDDPTLVKRLAELAKSGGAQAKKGVMDAGRCVRPADLVPMLEAELSAPDPEVVAYAAEAAARVDDPALVAPLLAAFEKRKTACKADGLEGPEAEVCIWLTYAPGALLGKADEPTRTAVAKAAAEMFEAPHPKIREVAVESVASARLKVYAEALAGLIQRETKPGGFQKPNERALVDRFRSRLAALKKGS
ncbi:MAG: hypothetical protein U1E65_31640 [Myxococcota bacterium]